MALVGGGGSPNVAGSNPAGTGTSLNYIGDHAYAYSGLVTNGGTGSASTTMLVFTTGTSYFVGEINFIDGEQGGTNRFLDILFDGQSIFKGSWDDAPKQNANPLTSLIIPPYTNVEVKFGLGTTATATCTVTGRVYQ
jgi:hypothetical protein